MRVRNYSVHVENVRNRYRTYVTATKRTRYGPNVRITYVLSISSTKRSNTYSIYVDMCEGKNVRNRYETYVTTTKRTRYGPNVRITYVLSISGTKRRYYVQIVRNMYKVK